MINSFAMIIAVFLTNKYVHNYPKRYYTYLIVSHLKTAIIMATIIWTMGKITGISASPHTDLWTGFIFFVFADALVSVPCLHDIPVKMSSKDFKSE